MRWVVEGDRGPSTPGRCEPAPRCCRPRPARWPEGIAVCSPTDVSCAAPEARHVRRHWRGSACGEAQLAVAPQTVTGHNRACVAARVLCACVARLVNIAAVLRACVPKSPSLKWCGGRCPGQPHWAPPAPPHPPPGWIGCSPPSWHGRVHSFKSSLTDASGSSSSIMATTNRQRVQGSPGESAR